MVIRNKLRALLVFLLTSCPKFVFCQDGPNPHEVNHINQDGVPIVNSVLDKIDRPSEPDQNQCIQAAHDLAQYVEELNGKLFHMETQRQGEFFVRHGDRMAIISLIQREMVPPTDKIHHAIFHDASEGSGKYCEQILREGKDFAQRIYDKNIEYRRVYVKK